MIPLRDNIPSRHFPLMTVLIIVLNAVIFLYEVTLTDADVNAFFQRYGLVPARFLESFPLFSLSRLGDYVPMITAMFLHGGWLHVIGNMLFLWVFGDNVEDLMGPGRFLALYLVVGGLGNLAHAFSNPASDLPTVGASGAVAGILGAYLVNYPWARVVTLVPLGFFLTTVELPATFFLLFWFLLQLVNGVASLGVAAVGGVAWWAHIGGFVGGAVLVAFFRVRRPLR